MSEHYRLAPCSESPRRPRVGKVDRPGLFASFTQWIFAKNAEGKFELRTASVLTNRRCSSVQDFAADELLCSCTVSNTPLKRARSGGADRVGHSIQGVRAFCMAVGGELAQYLDDYDNAELQAAFLSSCVL